MLTPAVTANHKPDAAAIVLTGFLNIVVFRDRGWGVILTIALITNIFFLIGFKAASF